MSRFSLLLKGSSLRVAESLTAIAAGFITLPLMMGHLGEDLYGLWVLIGSFTGLMYIFDFGMSAAVTRHITHAISRDDHNDANRTINTALLLYSILGVIILLVTLLIAVLYQPESNDLISRFDLGLVIFLLGCSIAIEFPAKAFSGIANAYYRFDLISLYRMFFKIASTGLLLLLLFSGHSVVSIAMLSLGTNMASTLVFYWISRRIYPNARLSPRYISSGTIRNLFSYSAWAFFIDLNNLLKSRVDLFFIGGFISLSAVSIYYVPARLVEYTKQLLFKMLGITLPILTDHDANQNSAELKRDILLFTRINSYFSALAVAGALLLGQPVIHYWMGDQFDVSTAFTVLIILMGGRLASLVTDAFNTALYAAGMHRLTAYLSIVESLISAGLLAITLVVLERGPVYAALSVAIPIALGRLFVLPYVTCRALNLPSPLRVIGYGMRPLLLIVPAGGLLLFTVPPAPQLEWARLVSVGGYAVCVLLFMAVDLNEREKGLLRRLSSRMPFGGRSSGRAIHQTDA